MREWLDMEWSSKNVSWECKLRILSGYAREMIDGQRIWSSANYLNMWIRKHVSIVPIVWLWAYLGVQNTYSAGREYKVHVLIPQQSNQADDRKWWRLMLFVCILGRHGVTCEGRNRTRICMYYPQRLWWRQFWKIVLMWKYLRRDEA